MSPEFGPWVGGGCGLFCNKKMNFVLGYFLKDMLMGKLTHFLLLCKIGRTQCRQENLRGHLRRGFTILFLRVVECLGLFKEVEGVGSLSLEKLYKWGLELWITCSSHGLEKTYSSLSNLHLKHELGLGSQTQLKLNPCSNHHPYDLTHDFSWILSFFEL